MSSFCAALLPRCGVTVDVWRNRRSDGISEARQPSCSIYNFLRNGCVGTQCNYDSLSFT